MTTGVAARAAITQARGAVAHMINADPSGAAERLSIFIMTCPVLYSRYNLHIMWDRGVL